MLHATTIFSDTDRDLTERDFVLSLMDAAIGNLHDSIAEVGGWFRTDWLLDPLFHDVAETIFALVKENKPLSASNLARCLRSHTDRYEVSIPVLGELILSANGGSHLVYWGREVYDNYRRRAASAELLTTGTELQAACDVQDTLDEVAMIPEKYRELDMLRIDRSVDAVKSIVAELEGVVRPHFEIGVQAIDHLTHGFRNGSLVTIAAPPGQGKSVMLGQMAAVRATRDSKHVLFFSAEMSLQELLKRWAAWNARATRIERREYLQGLNVMGRLTQRDGPLQVFEGSRHISSIMAISRAYQATHNLGLICVDYVQRFNGGTAKDTRERQIADISQQLKTLACELSIPIVMACQYNRDYKGSPTMRNLRESGALEQDSDVIIHLDSDTDTKADVVESTVFVEKNRHGKTGKGTMQWNKPLFTFFDSEPKQHAEFSEYAS